MLDPVSENQSIRRLLIIEDDRLLRDHLVRATSGSPEWSVLAAGNLAAARAQLAKHAIDAVFLDLGLPDGDGLNLISEFR
jgi:DNA-binding response OmpR family regulator